MDPGPNRALELCTGPALAPRSTSLAAIGGRVERSERSELSLIANGLVGMESKSKFRYRLVETIVVGEKTKVG